MVTSFPYLSAICYCPLVAVLIILFLPPDRKNAIRWISVASGAVSLALTLAIYVMYDRSVGGFQFVERATWVESLGIHYYFAVDGINLPMVLLTSITLLTGVWTMWGLETRVKEYFALMLFMVVGVYGVFLSLDLFFLFVFYDVSLFPMYPLIAIWGTTRKEYGALKLTLYLLAGSALVLPGILYVYFQAWIFTFDLVQIAQVGLPKNAQLIAFFLFLFGFGVLAGLWPFHTWSPVGHVAAPTAVSMIHAGVLMKLGAYGVLRVGMFLCPLGLEHWAPLMAVLATIGIVYGAFVGLAQTDLKYVIGYSSVSHMGLVSLGLATATVGGINGAVFQMFSHGVMTALLFSSVGHLYDKTHTKMIPELGGMAKVMPATSFFFIFAALAGIGVPCLSSFWAELLVFIHAFRVYPVLGLFAILGLVVSALFMLRVAQKAFYGEKNTRFADKPDMSLIMRFPRAMLAGTLLLFGLLPRLMLDLINGSVSVFVQGLK
ncbi:MAG: NADH-quinone oxidoreductase subunit M [Deltaproteobacteria bacterium]|nr:NADH-quinone oxidoreductase subunit M [Deltaproteobacteria bacterium]